MNEEAVFALLKKLKPKMKVDKKHQVRKGPHCPLTMIGRELGMDVCEAEDYDTVVAELCLDEEWAEDFVYAADYSLEEMVERDVDQSDLRKRIFKVLNLPKKDL